jgi:hypothetical protein
VFNLTAKELETSNADPAFRLCAVTHALGAPTVHVLTGPELASMQIDATQYRARPRVT